MKYISLLIKIQVAVIMMITDNAALNVTGAPTIGVAAFNLPYINYFLEII